jgi:hypothetical protein
MTLARFLAGNPARSRSSTFNLSKLVLDTERHNDRLDYKPNTLQKKLSSKFLSEDESQNASFRIRDWSVGDCSSLQRGYMMEAGDVDIREICPDDQSGTKDVRETTNDQQQSHMD